MLLIFSLLLTSEHESVKVKKNEKHIINFFNIVNFLSNPYDLYMDYKITSKELTCINILIKVLEEAINRNCFTEKEVNNILKTIDTLTK